MTDYTIESLALIYPVSLIPQIESLASAAGFQTNLDSGPEFSPTGEIPATHRALHTTVRPSFLMMITGDTTGHPQEDIDLYTSHMAGVASTGATQEQVDQIRSMLLLSYGPKAESWGMDRVNDLALANGLVRIQNTDEQLMEMVDETNPQ